MYGYIVAIHEEIQYLLESAKLLKTSTHNHIDFYHIRLLSGKEIIAAKSGVGKVHAALTAQILICEYKVKYIINSGIAGGTDEIGINDFVIADRVVYHDVNISSYRSSYKVGELRDMPQFYISDNQLLTRIQSITQRLNFVSKLGTIASGDKFIKDYTSVSHILEQVDNIYAFDMESAAIGHVTYLYNIPFISFRCISDVITENPHREKFNFDIQEACKKVSLIMQHF